MAEEFRLGVGGPLHRVERVAHLDQRRVLVVAAIELTWVPLLLLSLASGSSPIEANRCSRTSR